MRPVASLVSSAIRVCGLLLVGAVTACGVGSGSGRVKGDLNLLGCEGKDVSTFDLSPTFFSGEPFDDPTSAASHNQLFIRIQRSGARVENVDGLAFSILSTYEVARCLGAFVDANGNNDWDDRYCDRSAGTARLRIGLASGGEQIKAGFSPYGSCPNAGILGHDSSLLSGVALGDCDLTDPAKAALNPVGCPSVCPGEDSWIEFSVFGGIAGPVTQPVDKKFIVNYDETIRASAFHLNLCDTVSVDAFVNRRFVPSPRLFGSLDGWFDFDLRRGQGAQTFP